MAPLYCKPLAIACDIERDISEAQKEGGRLNVDYSDNMTCPCSSLLEVIVSWSMGYLGLAWTETGHLMEGVFPDVHWLTLPPGPGFQGGQSP